MELSNMSPPPIASGRRPPRTLPRRDVRRSAVLRATPRLEAGIMCSPSFLNDNLALPQEQTHEHLPRPPMNVDSPIEDTNGPWYLDDLSVGLRFRSGSFLVDEQQMKLL